MFPCAYLRVFQPLEAFPAEERGHWERYIVAGGRARPSRPIYRERSAAPQGPIGLLSSAEGDHADLRLVDGSYCVCPCRTRVRELARIRRRQPSAVPFMLQSPWHVPIRWFVLFDDEDRRLAETPEGFRLTYRTAVPAARKRAEAALSALRRSELAPLSDMVGDLGRWLASFDHRSIVELDYDRVSDLFGWDELDNDHSAREIQESVSALRTGDLAKAAELYQSVAGRWAEVRSHESLN